MRGAVPPALASAGNPLVAASAAAAAALEAGVLGGGDPAAPLYLADPPALAAAAAPGGAPGWGLLPAGAGCALVQPLPAAGGGGGSRPAGWLVLGGDRPGALTERDRVWAAALATKLGGVV